MHMVKERWDELNRNVGGRQKKKKRGGELVRMEASPRGKKKGWQDKGGLVVNKGIGTAWEKKKKKELENGW